MTPLLTAHELTIRRGQRTLVTGLNLALEANQSWGVMGGNGTGKSSLLHCLAGLAEISAGSIELEGRTLPSLSRKAVARRLGILLQEPGEAFPDTVWNTVLIGRHPHLSRWQSPGENDFIAARAALRLADLDGMEQRMTTTLSGGERRRLAFATLLVQNPALFLLDEPTNHLDLVHQLELLDRLAAICAGDRASLMVLHDINLAARFCSHLLFLYGDGQWCAGPAAELLEPEPLSRLFGHPIRVLEDGGRRVFVPE